MKILMIDKFLYLKGGAETYVIKLGEALQSQGHEVQYFGMDGDSRILSNAVGAYVKEIDFHNSSFFAQLTYPFKIIYSAEARKKIRLVLEDFRPELVHLNTFNYQLTPSIILEIRKWEKESGNSCKIIYTAHDPQLVCPNHMCMNPNTHKVCEKCLTGNYWPCTSGRCIHGSLLRSFLGSLEAFVWHRLRVYEKLDKIICCSHFMKGLLDTDSILAKKTVALHNFTERVVPKTVQKKDYVLYFGRYSEEKGIATLVQAAKDLPEIPFIFAGSGPLEYLLEDIPNIKNVGFKSGEELEMLIRQARFSVIPSEWYENCPFTVMESHMYGTPVVGADIGGIPELIREGETGELFESGNGDALTEKISAIWNDRERMKKYSENCKEYKSIVIEEYCEKLLDIYASA